MSVGLRPTGQNDVDILISGAFCPGIPYPPHARGTDFLSHYAYRIVLTSMDVICFVCKLNKNTEFSHTISLTGIFKYDGLTITNCNCPKLQRSGAHTTDFARLARIVTISHFNE